MKPSVAASPYLQITELRKQLMAHPVYRRLDRAENIRAFMEAHVFAVWDFMSLLKSLQRSLTCVEVPWIGKDDAAVARFINEIVVGEECDEDGRGNYRSHFELYLDAMEECGADASRIHRFLGDLKAGKPWERALADLRLAPHVDQFVRFTLTTALSGEPHKVAAAFFYGREDVIPDMFRACLAEMERLKGKQPERLRYYLDRHIQVDGESHGPLARRMLVKLCGDDRVRHREATDTALGAIRARITLWDGLQAEIDRAA